MSGCPPNTDMTQQWDEILTALESGDADRVNESIDDIKDRDISERIELVEMGFEDLVQLYHGAASGYVRQSVIRAIDELVPGMVGVAALENDDRSLPADEADIRHQTDEICGFLLEAIIDDDGRVRQAAKRALKGVFRTYDSLEDEETIEALENELAGMAERHSGKQRKHLLEAKESAEHTLQSPLARIIDGFHDEFGESLQ
jgi:hypothetical protein